MPVARESESPARSSVGSQRSQSVALSEDSDFTGDDEPRVSELRFVWQSVSRTERFVAAEEGGQRVSAMATGLGDVGVLADSGLLVMDGKVPMRYVQIAIVLLSCVCL